jgi:hypothetical protein
MMSLTRVRRDGNELEFNEAKKRVRARADSWVE